MSRSAADRARLTEATDPRRIISARRGFVLPTSADWGTFTERIATDLHRQVEDKVAGEFVVLRRWFLTYEAIIAGHVPDPSNGGEPTALAA